MLSLVKTLGKWLMVVSLCAAVGLHWTALQSVAWAGMLLNYSRCGSITSAVEKTFDGAHPCPLCKAIAKGQQGGKKQEYRAAGKIDMDYHRAVALIAPPMRDHEWARMDQTYPGVALEPGVPPPRAA
jgi:hypothetical protein